jgi:hypothetical protein
MERCEHDDVEKLETILFPNWYLLGSAIIATSIKEIFEKYTSTEKPIKNGGQRRISNKQKSIQLKKDTFAEGVVKKYGMTFYCDGLFFCSVYNFKHSLELKGKRLLSHVGEKIKKVHKLKTISEQIEKSITLEKVIETRKKLFEHTKHFDCYKDDIKSILKTTPKTQYKNVKTLICLLEKWSDFLVDGDEQNDAFRFPDSEATKTKGLLTYKVKSKDLKNLENDIHESIKSQEVFRMFRIYALIQKYHSPGGVAHPLPTK